MNTFHTNNRAEWRQWLAEHFETETEVLFVFPTIHFCSLFNGYYRLVTADIPDL